LLRRKLKGWSRNVEAAWKKTKNKLISEIESWDKLAEQKVLNNEERSKRKMAWSELDKI
jgi:hypothetical protein